MLLVLDGGSELVLVDVELVTVLESDDEELLLVDVVLVLDVLEEVDWSQTISKTVSCIPLLVVLVVDVLLVVLVLLVLLAVVEVEVEVEVVVPVGAGTAPNW